MRLIRPGEAASGNNSRRGLARPHDQKWLKEWIAERPRYVILRCKHKYDINDRSLIVIRQFGKVFGAKNVTILCERCNAFHPVVRSIDMREYFDLPPAAENPTEPLF